MTGLQGKVVLITGAKGGLGTHVTQAFLDAGANVVGVSRSIANADYPHPRFTALQAALDDSAAATSIVETAVQRFERVDSIVHLVGGFAGGKPLAETDDEMLDRMLEMNLKPAFHILRAAVGYMRTQGYGRILAVGSRAAVEPQVGVAAYSASKAALISLIRAVAIENKDKLITANIVLPGTMDTPANRAAMPTADPKRWVSPDQVASLLAYLASDAAGQITGAAIPVYGGEV